VSARARAASIYGLAALAVAAAAVWLATPAFVEYYGIDLPWGPDPKPPFELTLSNPAAGQGELLGLCVSPTGRYRLAQQATAKFTGLRGVEEVVFSRVGERLLALVPVSYSATTGEYAFEVAVLDSRGETHVLGASLTVETREFEIQRIQMTQQQTGLMSSDNLQKDREKTAAAKAHPAAEPLWSGPFVRPVVGRISTEFGMTRYVNGVLWGRHSGIDIAAKEGTPVLAANSGRVVLADVLIATGNTVIIDHGLGLFTAYNHMSRLDVAVGDVVEKGRQIGMVGSTGFSSGAHLHLTMSVGTVATNPWPWFEADPLELLGGTP
jgi:murein DD-endopeptidase MepM/ murein hydrolase activator NlpD